MSTPSASIRFLPRYGNIWRISYPLMLAGISETLIDITDTIFLARYGLTELAAIGLADAWFMLFLFLSLGLVDGIQIIVSRRAGEKREHEIGRVFNQGLYLMVIVSVVMTGLILLMLSLGAGDLLASDEVALATESYLRIAAFSLLFQSLNLAFGTFFIAIGQTRILIGAALVLAGSNIALDYLLIFGKFGLPEMGIEGAAVASLTAEILACLFLAGSIVYKGFNRHYGLLRFERWNHSISRSLISLSWPVAMDTLVDLMRWFLLFAIIEQIGEAELASANIIYSCFMLFMIFIESISEAVCSMTSNLLGQGQQMQMPDLIRKSTQLGYAVIVPLLLLALLFPDVVLAIFTEDQDLVDLSRNGYRIVLLALLIAVPGDMLYAAVVGTGDTKATLGIQFVATSAAIAFTLWAALIMSLPLKRVLLVEIIVWSLYLLLSWLRLRSGRWRQLKV